MWTTTFKLREPGGFSFGPDAKTTQYTIGPLLYDPSIRRSAVYSNLGFFKEHFWVFFTLCVNYMNAFNTLSNSERKGTFDGKCELSQKVMQGSGFT